MKWYLRVLRKYAVFSGRASRKEYWMFILFNIIFSVAAGVLDGIFGFGGEYGFFRIIYGLAVFLPSVAAFVRRLHDVGKSAWILLVGIIPIAGIIWLFILSVLDSRPGDNKYGPDPKTEAGVFR